MGKSSQKAKVASVSTTKASPTPPCSLFFLLCFVLLAIHIVIVATLPCLRMAVRLDKKDYSKFLLYSL
ncbi:hypothetical protein ACA910_008774 [Epithemia clementina (nom. ined.)]